MAADYIEHYYRQSLTL